MPTAKSPAFMEKPFRLLQTSLKNMSNTDHCKKPWTQYFMFNG